MCESHKIIGLNNTRVPRLTPLPPKDAWICFCPSRGTKVLCTFGMLCRELKVPCVHNSCVDAVDLTFCTSYSVCFCGSVSVCKQLPVTWFRLYVQAVGGTHPKATNNCERLRFGNSPERKGTSFATLPGKVYIRERKISRVLHAHENDEVIDMKLCDE